MKKLPPDNTGKKYLVKRSAKQDKFIDIYVSGYGELTATECAIRAGYEKSSAHTRAHELLDWRQNPEVVREIDEKLKVHKAIWMVDKEKHLANLTRIGNEARAKGLFGVAGKMEELKGRAQGFYVDRNITMTKEIIESIKCFIGKFYVRVISCYKICFTIYFNHKIIFTVTLNCYQSIGCRSSRFFASF